MMKEIHKNLEKLYEEKSGDLKKAKEQLRILLENIIVKIKNERLVRATISKIRIKPLDSLRRKAEVNRWSPEEAFIKATDLVGARVVCNNTQDISRFHHLLFEIIPDFEGEPKTQNYTQQPKDSGYRAIHINFRLHVYKSQSLISTIIPCEVQIRTFLQDAWAELVHHDIYKDGSELPVDLHDRTKDLADILCTADGIADKVRNRVMMESQPPDKHTNLDKINKDSLVHIFSCIFGRYPPEYVVHETLNISQDVGLSSANELLDLLQDSIFKEAVDNAYKQETGQKISYEDIFLAAPIAVMSGLKLAIKTVRKKGKEHRKEIENYWRNEILSELPETIEEFIEKIQYDDNTWVYQIAEVFGVAKEYAISGEELINPEEFEETIYNHYGIDELDYRIVTALTDAGVS